MRISSYEWLNDVGTLPKMVSCALKYYGTLEKPGKGNNATIMKWADQVGVARIGYKYTADEVPWCGLFMAVVALEAGKPIPKGPLYALNWGAFGVKSAEPSLGDVLVFKRNGGGHVGLYIGEDDICYHVLGGNQSDSVSITRINKNRLFTCRRPPFKIAMPASVKPYLLKATGNISKNEA